MMKRTLRMRRAAATAFALGLLASGLTGCAEGADAACSANSVAAAHLRTAVGSMQMGDVDTASSTEELAARAEVIVRGEVVDVQDGPLVGRPGQPPAELLPLVVVSIGEVEVLSGALPANSDGNLYLALWTRLGAEVVREALSSGTQVLLYGDRIVEGTNVLGNSDPLVNPDAGRPAGQPLFQAAHPQGLVFQFGDGPGAELAWPATQTLARGTLDDAVPGGALTGYPAGSGALVPDEDLACRMSIAAAGNLLDFTSGLPLTWGEYDAAHRTDDLAALAEVVVRGEVVSMQDGPSLDAPGDQLGTAAPVLAIGELQVLAGELPPESDGRLYLMLPMRGGVQLIREALPLGTPVLVYGTRGTGGTTLGGDPLVNLDAGRPAGQPLFQAAHPQGLVFQFGDGPRAELAWPATQYLARGVLDDAAPGGRLTGRPNAG